MSEKPSIYPPTRREDITENHHGTHVADPYRWLEDDRSPETAAWAGAQNRVTREYLSGIPFRDKLRERLCRLWDYPKMGVPRSEGQWYYYTRNDGLQNQAVLYRSAVMGGPEELFLDPNDLSADGTTALNAISFSDDGRYCAYSVSESGSDWAEIRVIDTLSKASLPERIGRVKFSIASWSADSHGFYYSAYDTPDEAEVGSDYSAQNRFQKVYFHSLGDDPASDILVYCDPDHPLRYFHCAESADGKYIFINVSEGTHGTEVLYRETAKPQEEFRVLLPGFGNDYEIIHAQSDMAYVFTNEAAPNFRLFAVELGSEAPAMRDIIPERADATLEVVTAVGGYLMAIYLRDASSEVLQYDTQGNFIRRLDLDGICSVSGFSGKKEDTRTFYSVTSYTSPAVIYSYDLADGTSELIFRPQTGFDPDLYVTRQVFFESRDGTRVPMFVVHGRDIPLDGSNPLLMYGYGGFNISHPPAFNPSVVMLLEQGGIFVDVTLRGGGEYGERWHRAGMLGNKQNVFDDFIAAAEYLIREGYTSPGRLAIMGGSNGGLLVGACMTQRPELFAVAVPQVGVLDMLRYHLFTIGWGWIVEYGDPDDPAQFEYLYRYSPLHNVVEGVCYPATLITTAEHDDRVVPAHSFKFAAALQKAQGCDRPVLIRIDADAGHGAGKPTDKRIDEAADIYSFIFKNVGVEPVFPSVESGLGFGED